jgi:hypothetical protein
MPGSTQLIHLYGNITRSSAAEFKTRFLLTESHRYHSPLIKTAWMRRFHDDVLGDESVVFVGFSLTDIDLRTLLSLFPREILHKVHFITRPGEKRPIITRLSKFGKPHQIGIDGFSRHLEKKRPGSAVKKYSILPTPFREIHFDQKISATISPADIENLLITGDFDHNKLAEADLNGGRGAYTISKQLCLCKG